MMYRGVFLTAVLAIGLLATPALAAPSDEAELIRLFNGARTTADLEPLQVDVGLFVSARVHTAEMIEDGSLSHSSPGELATAASDWELMGENVGRGPDANAIHEAFMASESHRANILGDFDAIGVGIDQAEDGTRYATVIFMRRSVGARDDDSSSSGLTLISGLHDFALSAVMRGVDAFERAAHDLCSPLGSRGAACID